MKYINTMKNIEKLMDCNPGKVKVDEKPNVTNYTFSVRGFYFSIDVDNYRGVGGMDVYISDGKGHRARLYYLESDYHSHGWELFKEMSNLKHIVTINKQLRDLVKDEQEHRVCISGI